MFINQLNEDDQFDLKLIMNKPNISLMKNQL